jgi:itaconate CoA-transferase
VDTVTGGRPLDGMIVVALEQAVAAPLATRHLADLGARVIKIERPGRGDFARDYDSAAGDGFSSWFVWLNRSKESVVLDLKTGPGRQALDALIDRADVFVCNLAPAAIRRLGLEPDKLVVGHPRLVACQLSGYGEDGPYAGRKAYDLLVQAEAGVLAVTGTEDAPAKAGISVADIAGGMYAYSGILAALLQRGRTGRGGTVKVSLFDALAEWMSSPLQSARLTGKAPERTGARHASILPYGGYLTADGDEVMLAVQNEAEWARLCGDVLGLPGMLDGRFAGNQRRMEHRQEVERRLAAAVARLPTGDLLARLERAGLPYASAKTVLQVLEHPQLAPRWTAVAAGDRSVDVLPPPARHGGFGPVLGPVPAHGEHTEAVLAEFAPGQVRAARPDDAQGIAAVHVAAWQDAYAGLLPDEFLAGLDPGGWAQRWRDRLAAPGEGVFTLVFDSGGRVQGFVSGGPGRDGFPGGEVYAIYVVPGCQGRGAGRSLLAAATGLLDGAGFTDACLWVLSGNSPARGFYESQGWQCDGTEQPWTLPGGASVPEVRYVRTLGA